MRRIENRPAPEEVYQLVSLDVATGEVKDHREVVAFASLPIFATNDQRVVVAGPSLLRLTPDLKDVGSFDYKEHGYKYGNVENISPDGTTLGSPTSPGFDLLDSQNFKLTHLTSDPAVDTSVNNAGFVTDNVHWIGDYPKDIGFVTYVDGSGQHLIYHGKCGGRPQFLTNDVVLEPGCKKPMLIDTKGNFLRSVDVNGAFSFAGVSQNGKRFALQVASFPGMHSVKKEQFVIYSVETGERIAEITPEETADEQSWTAFSPDGSEFVVGSALRLTLFRLP